MEDSSTSVQAANLESCTSGSESYDYDSDNISAWIEEAERVEREERLATARPSSSNTVPRQQDSAASVPRRRPLNELYETDDADSSTTISASPQRKRARSGETIPESSRTASPPLNSANIEHPYVIEDDPKFRSVFNGAPIGFWWELARHLPMLRTSKKLENLPVIELKKLCVGQSNVIAVPYLQAALASADAESETKLSPHQAPIKAFEQERVARMPWEELDREESHEGHAARTGSCAYLQDEKKDWYGGKVHFAAKLMRKASQFSIVLEEPYLSSSTTFSRRFGSKRFVRIKIPDEIFYNDDKGEMVKFFQRPFVLFKAVFRAFFAKDHTVFLFRTTEEPLLSPRGDGTYTVQSRSPGATTSPYDLSLLDFIQWHNPLHLNKNQLMVKWASRFALGLSNSVPGVRIEKENMAFIPDIVAPRYASIGPSKVKIPTECIMTDGCGLANGDFFAALAESLRSEWYIRTTTIQIRINGSKGLLTIDPHETTTTSSSERKPKVWIRDSQHKIIYPTDDNDAAHYTVDILRSAHMSTPAQLSTETIINLAENGVPPETFAVMMRESFKNRVDKLTLWDGPDGLYKLRKNVGDEGHVVAARLARENAGSARAKGYVYEDPNEPLDIDCLEEDKAAVATSTAWWEDPVSGQPSSLEETCVGLLDAGFSPSTCLLLREKLMKVAEKAVDLMKTKYRIEVPLSCTAFVIPDPLGILEPGECQIKFSSRKVQDANGVSTDMILGPVLLTRHPCKLPSDIQRAEAVYRDELRYFVDVIVISTKGHIINGKQLDRHLASMTGGGDYDGDLMSAFWQPDLTTPFRCSSPKFAEEPECLKQFLFKSHETVDEFLNRRQSMRSDLQIMAELQSYLLAPLRNTSLVGRYSTCWENSIYMNGYSHSETVRLAHMFCAILDGSKTGVSVQAEQRKRDMEKYTRSTPAWKKADASAKGSSNMPSARRRADLPPFIMDILREEIKKEYDIQRRTITERLKPIAVLPDEDLQRPWKEFIAKTECSIAPGDTADCSESQTLISYLKRMQNAIETHVNAVFDEWTKSRSSTNLKSQTFSRSKGGAQFTDLPIVKRQDSLRALSLKFASYYDATSDVTLMHDEASVARLKASYAYILGCRKGKTRFPFDVAYRDLCAIKAQAVSNGTQKTVTSAFYARMDLHKVWFGNN